MSVYFSPRLSCHLFSPYFSCKPFAAAVHTISYFLGCLLSFLYLFFLHLWLFLPFLVCVSLNAVWCLLVGVPAFSLGLIVWKSLSVEMITHTQTAKYFFSIVLQEQMLSWVECAGRKWKWVTIHFLLHATLFFCKILRMRRGFYFAEYLCPWDYAGPWSRITFREADPKKELLGEQYELAVHMWLYFGNSDSNSVDRRILISGSHNLPL